MEANYITSAARADQFMDWNYPEIVFLGRSNCGKSSLLNAVLNSKSIARVSSSPGRTRMVNFFSLSPRKGQMLIFADLPGWGYNTAAKEIQRLWDDLLDAYLKRTQIKDLLVLIDVRREFVAHELEFLRQLTRRASVSCVLTKADKLNSSELALVEKQTQALFSKEKIHVSNIFVVSSLKKKGIDELRNFLFRHLNLNQ
jgi:GTP-binding protein